MTTFKPEDQWRIDNARHLKGLRLRFSRYSRRSASWDHDHCAACWAKFAEFDGPDIQHVGFRTCDDYKLGAGYDWLCQKCCNDLKAAMEWTIADTDSEDD